MSVAESLMILLEVFASEVPQKTCMLKTRLASKVAVRMPARQNCSVWKGIQQKQEEVLPR